MEQQVAGMYSADRWYINTRLPVGGNLRESRECTRECLLILCSVRACNTEGLVVLSYGVVLHLVLEKGASQPMNGRLLSRSSRRSSLCPQDTGKLGTGKLDFAKPPD